MEETRNLLEQWGLSAFYRNFEENCVEADSFSELDDSSLRGLFDNKIGCVAKFKKNFKSFKSSPAPTTRTNNKFQTAIWVSHVASADYLSEEENIFDFKSELDCSLRVPGSEGNEEVGNREATCAGVGSNPGSSLQDPLSDEDIVEEHSDSSTTNSNKRPPESNPAHSEVPAAKKRAPTSGENVLEAYLKKTTTGRALLMIKKLEPSDRSKLCQEIVLAEIGSDADKSISGKRFEFLAECIEEIFPEEAKCFYFMPRIPATSTQRAVQPKGILYDKYHNYLKFLRRAGIRSSIRQKSTAIEELSDVDDPEDSVKKDLEWLKTSSTTCPRTCELKWQNTADYRLQLLRNCIGRKDKKDAQKDKIEAVFSNYECLKQQKGIELLLKDFHYLYDGKHKSLVENWPSIAAKLIKLGKGTQDDLHPGAVLDCLNLIPTWFHQSILIGPKPSKKDVKTVTWKPNFHESKQGFFLQVPTLGNLEEYKERMKAKCAAVRETLQPFPAAVGPTEDGDFDYYVIIDDIQYRMESALLAFDSCFKVYQALHCSYPCQSSHSWIFVQKALYEIDTEWDPSIPKVAAKVITFKRLNLSA